MDLGTIIGLIAGAAVVVYGMYSGGDVSSYIDVGSFIVTMGGGFFSTIMGFPLSETIRAFKAIPLIFKEPKTSAMDTIRTLVELSQKARREGLLALESAQDAIKDDFLNKAMELVVDGIEAEIVKTTMELDIDSMAVRHQNAQAYFKALAAQFRMVGAIEKHHEERYLNLKKNILEEIVFKRDDDETRWICRNCGHIYVGKAALKICPVCKFEGGYFEIKAENY